MASLLLAPTSVIRHAVKVSCMIVSLQHGGIAMQFYSRPPPNQSVAKTNIWTRETESEWEGGPLM